MCFRYVVSQKWFDRWNRHVKYDGDHPGPIENHDILLSKFKIFN